MLFYENRGGLPPIPDYLKTIYHWAYLHPRNVICLDREWIVNLILWGNAKRIRRCYMEEIPEGSRVLQAAHVYGVFVQELIEKIGLKGQLDLFDIAPIQLSRCQQKLSGFDNVAIWVADAKHPFGESSELGESESGAYSKREPYDVVSSFFLLHELPDEDKHLVVQSLLANVKPGGKALFVDYHRPHSSHPLKPIMKWVFKRLEPFANTLWERSVDSFAGDWRDSFQWSKRELFGGMYQVVVARAK